MGITLAQVDGSILRSKPSTQQALKDLPTRISFTQRMEAGPSGPAAIPTSVS